MKKKERKSNMRYIKKMIIIVLVMVLMSGLISLTSFAAEADGRTEMDKSSVVYENTAKGIVDESIRTYLNLRSGSGMGYEVIGHLLPGDEVEVIGRDGEWYKITIPVSKGYVHSDYLQVSMENKIVESDKKAESHALTPEGNMTLVDDVGTKSGSGQQFITLVTKNGNYFYLIIDRDDDGTENVHFLNMVDEADLYALIDDGQREAWESEQEKEVIMEVPKEEIATEPEPVVEEKEAGINVIPVILIILIMAGAAGYYFYSQMDKKKKVEIKPDPDADYDEDQISEDDDIVILEDDEENDFI